MIHLRAPRALHPLGALLVVLLGFPVVAFLVRVVGGHGEGWHAPGLFAAVGVSLLGATAALLVGGLLGIPLAYLLARHHGPLWRFVGLVVQLPLAIPPLVSGILLVSVIGPYTFLGEHAGQALTQTVWGVIIAMTFVSTPFLVVAARSAFRSVDPALAEVAATLGHGRVSRFVRVELHAAAEGVVAGMVLMWLRAFGEYGTVVVLAYHPYSLPVYVENLFTSAPLAQADAPTLIAFAVAVLAVGLGGLGRRGLARSTPARGRRAHGRSVSPVPPPSAPPRPLNFALDARVGGFALSMAHRGGAHHLAVIGPSGAGKSVALRALAGLLGAGVGEVTVAGTPVGTRPAETRGLAYVPQGYGLLPRRTVWEQVTFGVGADPGRAAWWLRTLGLDDLHERRPEQLSGGQRQRVSLARALATDPQVVLLDEPFGALDAPVRAGLRRELRRLQHETNLSTVLVTHDPVEAAMLAEEIIVVADGRVLQAGRCAEVFARPASLQVGALLGIENLMAADGGAEPVRRLLAALGDPPGLGPVLWRVAPEAVALRPGVGAGSAGSGGEAGDAANSMAAGDRDRIRLGTATVTDCIPLGQRWEVVVAVTGVGELRSWSVEAPAWRPGDPAVVELIRSGVRLWRTAPAAH
ncbi:MAG TPA: ATP-binding cassette domain-containing protein [Solirubrobacteraceae bacterium]|nr:ATP-binding cassette domain-containing protein [Solirubrobacteraceae bacterium]